MQKYHVILVNGQKIEVEGQFEMSPTNALIIKNGNEVLQVFAPGAWITVFKASAILPVTARHDISRPQ